jgi:hypothetical protein
MQADRNRGTLALPPYAPSQGDEWPHSADALRPATSQIHRLGLEDISADAELDIVQPGTALSEFYRLSMAAASEPLISSGVRTAAEAARLTARLGEPDFMACGFAFIGAWGRRNAGSRT